MVGIYVQRVYCTDAIAIGGGRIIILYWRPSESVQRRLIFRVGHELLLFYPIPLCHRLLASFTRLGGCIRRFGNIGGIVCREVLGWLCEIWYLTVYLRC